jgi:hypothetical protein
LQEANDFFVKVRELKEELEAQESLDVKVLNPCCESWDAAHKEGSNLQGLS